MRKTEVIGRMEIQSYKCPNCGGGLVFDPKTQKFKCEYCLSAFTEETLKEMEEAARKSEEASKPGGMPEAEKIESQKQAESKMVLYTCPSCGAEIVAPGDDGVHVLLLLPQSGGSFGKSGR